MKKWAYYNENCPKKIAALKALMGDGFIMDGEVDGRSIKDVQPDDLKGFIRCGFFAGIGVWDYALQLAKWPEDREVWHGSCPCQSFSNAGSRKGMNDDRHLWPYWFNLIRERKPLTVFGEQVEAAINFGWLDLVQTDMEGEGYAFAAKGIPAAGVGAPHIRQRLWFVADSTVQRQQQQPNGRSAELLGKSLQPGRSGDQPSGMGATSSNMEFSESDGRQQRGSESGGRGVAGGCGSDRLAHHHEGSQGRIGMSERAGECIAGTDGLASGMEFPESQRHGCGEVRNENGTKRSLEIRGQDEGLRFSGITGTSGGIGLADDESQRCGETGTGSGRPEERLGDSGESSRMANNNNNEQFGQEGVGKAELAGRGEVMRPGPVNGFWRDADWLFCRDGKWRPVKSGTFPLAYGYPERVGLLHCAGDAIVAEVAKVFIESFLESETVFMKAGQFL